MECSEANIKKVKKSLIGKIKKEESIIEFATVKLSICSPQTGKVFRSLDKEGILCVIVDRNKSCLYLKQYDLIEFKLIFSIELYTNIADGYTVNDNHFHVIEFPGFFLGLSFPILDNPNVANRSSLIQKTIISTSKFISIKLNEYVYLYEFDNNREIMKKTSRSKVNDKRLSSSKIMKNPKSNTNDKISMESKDNNTNNENNSNNNNKSIDNNKENESSKKLNNIKENEINKGDNISEGKKAPEVKENDDNNIEENKNSINEESQKQLEITKKKPETEKEREKKFFDSIPIEDVPKKKVYKIVQFHLIREEMKAVKKLYIKNFKEFIDVKKLSPDLIKNYKINKYDSLNDLFYSSDEGEEQKSIVDYIQGRDIIGDLEDEHAIEEDDRVKELRQKRNNLKEIIEKKNVNETAMQTNPV